MTGTGGFRSIKQRNVARSAMNETPATKADSQLGTAVRKPWHSPCLTVAELASTDAMSHTGSDGGPPGTSFS